MRENSRNVQSVPRATAEFGPRNVCEETTQGWGENHPMGLKGLVPGAHTEPGVVPIPTH